MKQLLELQQFAVGDMFDLVILGHNSAQRMGNGLSRYIYCGIYVYAAVTVLKVPAVCLFVSCRLVHFYECIPLPASLTVEINKQAWHILNAVTAIVNMY